MTFVIITGTPGTGKTTLGTKLATMVGYKLVDGTSVAKTISSEEKDGCVIVDEHIFARHIIKQFANEDCIIDSHMSQFIPSSHVKLCIVTQCNLGELKQRLLKRGYDSHKIRENLEAEAMEVCLTEAQENNHKILVIKTDEKINFEEVKKRIIA